jgi:hypothetical protein
VCVRRQRVGAGAETPPAATCIGADNSVAWAGARPRPGRPGAADAARWSRCRQGPRLTAARWGWGRPARLGSRTAPRRSRAPRPPPSRWRARGPPAGGDAPPQGDVPRADRRRGHVARENELLVEWQRTGGTAAGRAAAVASGRPEKTPLDRVRCALAPRDERFGQPCFFIREKKTWMYLDDHCGDGRRPRPPRACSRRSWRVARHYFRPPTSGTAGGSASA